MTNQLLQSIITALICGLIFISCADDEVPSPFTINFPNEEEAISSSYGEVEVTIVFSRSASSSGSIELEIGNSSLIYGLLDDYYTIPEAVNDIITLQFSEGDESTSFRVLAGEGLNIRNEEQLSIAFRPATDNVFTLGTSANLTLSFSENFVAKDGTLEFDAGGEEFSHQSFIDLSKLKHTSVNKLSWDLGFYAENGKHNVILNSSANMMARKLDKNDLNAVSPEDTTGFGAEMVIPQFDPSVGSVEWIDTPDGDLSTTAFGTISTSETENNVFIIKRDGAERKWKKVRILQNGDNYTLQHADIDSDDFTTTEISKDDRYNFIFLDLDNGQTLVQPEKQSWDFMYGTYTESLNLGGPGLDIPYGYKDFIVLNRYQTSVAIVMIADFTYENFSLKDIPSVIFHSEIDALGENWRSGGGPASGPALYEDRFFLLKDAQKNIYKIKFTRLTSSSGERGYPEFIFERLQ